MTKYKCISMSSVFVNVCRTTQKRSSISQWQLTRAGWMVNCNWESCTTVSSLFRLKLVKGFLEFSTTFFYVIPISQFKA